MKHKMKGLGLSLALIAACPAIGEEGEGGYALGLREAVTLSLARNFTVRIDRLDPEKAGERLVQEKAAFDPSLTLSGGVSSTEVLDVEGADRQEFASAALEGVLPLGSRYRLGLSGSDRDRMFLGQAAEANSLATLSVSQPLLKNFGRTSTYAAVRIADKGYEVSKLDLQATIMRTVASTVVAYNELHFARQALEIAVRNRDLAKQLIEDNERRLKVGSIAQADMIVAEVRYALRKEIVLIAERQLHEQENVMKQLVFDSIEGLLDVRVEVAPLGSPVPFSVAAQDDLEEALGLRPDYQSAVLGIDINRLELDRDRRQQLPGLDLVGSLDYGSRGSSLGGGLSNLGDEASDSYSISTVFSMPLGNRRDRSQFAISQIELDQASLGLDQLRQGILLRLDNAARRVSSSWERIGVTRDGRLLAERSLEAEEKKLNLGVSSSFFVLELQGDLADAEFRESRAIADYFNAVAQYDLERGTILETYNIESHE